MDICQASFHEGVASTASELLKWGVLGSLLIGWLEATQKNESRFKRPAPWTLRDIACLLLSIASSALAIQKGVYVLHEQNLFMGHCPPMLRDALAHIATGIGLAGLSVMSSLRRRRGLGASGLTCCAMGMIFTAALLDLLALQQNLIMNQEIPLSDLHYQRPIVLLTGLFACFTMGCFIITGLRDVVVYDRRTLKTRKCTDEDTHSPFSILMVVVIYKHLKNVFLLSKTVVSDLPAISKRLASSLLAAKLHSRLVDTSRGTSDRIPFIMAVLRVFRIDVFWVMVVSFAYYGCLIVRIPILESLISDSTSSQIGTLSVLFIATCVGETLLSCYQMHLCMRLGEQLRSLVQAAMFQKMTRLSPTSRAEFPAGKVLSMMGVDSMMVSYGIIELPMPLAGIICLPLMFLMLLARVGIGPTVSCATWLLFVLLLPFPTSRIQNAQWRRIMQARDERLKLATDLLSSVRLVKMYAWEEAYIKTMKELREKEMVLIFRVNLLDGLLDSLYGASSSVMIIILFGALAVMNSKRIFNPELSFSCVYMMSMTDMVTNSASLTLRMLSLALLSMRRITDFCNAEEQENRQACSKNHTQREGAVVLEKCSFAWTNAQGQKPKAVLCRISLDVKPGALIGITGFVGSGKSTLVAAILGDMHCLDGTVDIKGKVAYVPQVPCIYNMTVRDNIVFGQSFEPARYSSVLRACELFTDINTFPAGDLTEVGEKGETLSGGQKQRISLARAAYSRSQIYLLDDPLSALDQTVADKVFKQVLGSNGLLKDTTRILVSNQGNLLKHMSLLMLMENNTLSVYHSLEELLQDERAPKTLTIGIPGQGQRGPTKPDEAALSQQDESNGRVTQLESLTSSKGSWDVTRALLRFSGLFMPAALVFFVASAVALAWQQLWIKEWTDANSKDNCNNHSDPSWVKGLAGLCVADVLFRCVGGALLAGSMRQLSWSLHYKMLSHVLSSPVSFFDSTPRGRVLNRFSLDLDAIDTRFYLSTKASAQNVLLAMSRLSVIATESPIILAIGGVGFVILVFGMRLIIRAVNEARFVEGASASRVLQHVTDTVDSLSTLRSYGMVERFCGCFCRLVDANMVPYNAFFCSLRVGRALLGAVGFAVVFATLIVALFTDTSGASGVGLALSSSLSNLAVVLSAVFLLICTHVRAKETPNEVTRTRK